MWPFSRSKAATPEQRERCFRRCGVALGTLEHCLAANAGNPEVCRNLETQVVHCHAEVVCPQLAAEHAKCFQRVVNSKGKEAYSACDKQVAAMKACLRKHGLMPFKAGRPGSSGSSGSNARRA